MKNNIIKISFLSVAIFYAAASLSLAQDSMKTTTKQHKSQMEMDKNMKMDRILRQKETKFL